jgi:diphosphomevalonate decarboxylase
MNWTVTSPSLALIKYWGKRSRNRNTPATSSVAVGIDAFHSYTRASYDPDGETDQVRVNGNDTEIQRYAPFFHYFKKRNRIKKGAFSAESWNDFPTSAGLASSSSGFAGLSLACTKALKGKTDPCLMSRLAGRGSASASRALWGGFTQLKAGRLEGSPLIDENHWPDLRVIIVEIRKEKKKISSRRAMEQSRLSSPFYPLWVKNSRRLFRNAVTAIENRDLDTLGPLMQASYLGMFSQMFSSSPPVIYWEPESLRIIKLCHELQNSGISVWETMDAGPQVKLLTKEKDVPQVAAAILDQMGEGFKNRLKISSIGGAPGERTSLPPQLHAFTNGEAHDG